MESGKPGSFRADAVTLLTHFTACEHAAWKSATEMPLGALYVCIDLE